MLSLWILFAVVRGVHGCHHHCDLNSVIYLLPLCFDVYFSHCLCVDAECVCLFVDFLFSVSATVDVAFSLSFPSSINIAISIRPFHLLTASPV